MGYYFSVEKDFAELLNEAINGRGWSQSELARRARLSPSTVSEVMSGKRAPSFEFCAAIARPLEMRPEELFRLAGLLPPLRGDEAERAIRELEEIARELEPEEQDRVTEYALWRLREQRARYRAGQSQAG